MDRPSGGVQAAGGAGLRAPAGHGAARPVAGAEARGTGHAPKGAGSGRQGARARPVGPRAATAPPAPGPVRPVVLSWSGGKDSALALARLAADPQVRVAGLLATGNEVTGRISIHGVRRALVEAQARALGLPLWWVPLSDPCSNADYEERMARALARLAGQGVRTVAFGDLFLADIRAYRERQLARAGMTALFPLWGKDTRELAAEVVASGIRAVVVASGPELGPRWLGRPYDARLLAELPAAVDPCGERGEFHTFVYDGPAFREPVAFRPGERVERGGFWYLDLLPAAPGEPDGPPGRAL
ncbi:ATP-binding protein [Thermaerobacter subterraneus]|uniref:PP-loop superfamily ATP-utilizing enzyme n=1 Tax=Thermaerobacter subterraneus DSM 13965 TaxID=867903 RepID=K6P3X8_9FIRM|nr:ATP-binding protein [Thermaerobacter subterraneus]EKP95755.1 PP-loop superfamily ATP-utilizing enzyme [Thermaerobacter subterraneus DSM 13965]